MAEAEKKIWMRRHPILSGFIILFILIFLVGIFAPSEDSSPQNNEQSLTSPNSVYNEPIITLSDISSFLEEFEANEIRAEDKYEGKIVSVSGRVDSINEGVFGPYLMLREDEFSFSGIDCTFNKEDQDEFIALSKDDYVTVKGKVSDYIIGSVVLDDCTLVG